MRLSVSAERQEGAALGDMLYQWLGPSRYLFEEGLTFAEANSNWTKILVELNDPELAVLPWEGISESRYFARLRDRLHIIRYRSRPLDRLMVPVEPPIDLVLLRGAEARFDPQRGWWVETHAPEVVCDAFKYFRTTHVEGPAVVQRLEQIAATMPIDILHLAAGARVVFSFSGALPVLDFYTGEPLVEPRTLARLLARCGTRLLVLDVPDAVPARTLAHQLLSLGGPPVLLIPEGPLRQDLISQTYYSIVHALPLDQLFWDQRELWAASALFLPEAASDALSGPAAADRVTEQSRALERIAARLEMARPSERDEFSSIRARLSDLSSQAYDWGHESEGIVPLSRITADLRSETQRLKSAYEEVFRAVNIWIEYENTEWPRQVPLQLACTYHLCIQIGRFRRESLIEAPRSLPEELLTGQDDEGVLLEVAIFTTDFDVPTDRTTLRLPPPPLSSNVLRVGFGTPTVSGVGRIRVAVYRDRYLLQSIVLNLAVGSQPARGPALAAILDFALEGDFLTIEEERERRALSIIVNQNDRGTHSFHVLGSDIQTKFDVGEVELVKRVSEARAQLQSIAGSDERGYSFDVENRGNIDQLVKHVGTLANFGYALFDDLMLRKSEVFSQALAAVPPNSIIQIAMTRSAKHVFPWALVYDKPFLRDQWRFCEVFQNDLEQGGSPGFLAQNRCLTARCPNWDDASILCPSGFWGFRHRIEQPLALLGDLSMDAATGTARLIQSGTPISVVLGVSLELKELGAHCGELSQIDSVWIDRRETREDIGKGLRRTDAAVVYFYCHGGRSGSDVWLGVGRRERLFPTDLRAWKISWPAQHPLVFINGCHTVDVNPDDLLTFTERFARCQAAGVIGTEIPVPETLARAFGYGFLDQFLSKPYLQVGQAVLAERLTLLERFNVLGLAYTSYCPADLAIDTH